MLHRRSARTGRGDRFRNRYSSSERTECWAKNLTGSDYFDTGFCPTRNRGLNAPHRIPRREASGSPSRGGGDANYPRSDHRAPCKGGNRPLSAIAAHRWSPAGRGDRFRPGDRPMGWRRRGRKGKPPQTYTSAFRPQSLRSPLPQAKCPSTVVGHKVFGFLSTKPAPDATFTPAFVINNSTAIVPHERRSPTLSVCSAVDRRTCGGYNGAIWSLFAGSRHG